MKDLDEKKLISARAADLIIGLRDGDAALLYLYLCRRGMGDREQIARDLYLPKQRLSEAMERLEMLGLLPLDPTIPEAPAEVPIPSGTSAAVVRPVFVDRPQGERQCLFRSDLRSAAHHGPSAQHPRSYQASRNL